MTNLEIDNFIIFSFPQTLIISDFQVKSYDHFSEVLLNRPIRRTVNRAVNWSGSNFSMGVLDLSHGCFGPFPLNLNLKLRRFDAK